MEKGVLALCVSEAKLEQRLRTYSFKNDDVKKVVELLQHNAEHHYTPFFDQVRLKVNRSGFHPMLQKHRHIKPHVSLGMPFLDLFVCVWTICTYRRAGRRKALTQFEQRLHCMLQQESPRGGHPPARTEAHVSRLL